MARRRRTDVNRGNRPEASALTVRRRMRATRRRDTLRERALRSALHRKGLRFRVDRCLPGTRRRADIVFVSAKVAVFVDGCFWHGCPTHGTWPKANTAWWRAKIHANIERDRSTDALLKADRWRVLRFWEHEDSSLAADKVARAVASARVRSNSSPRQSGISRRSKTGRRSHCAPRKPRQSSCRRAADRRLYPIHPAFCKSDNLWNSRYRDTAPAAMHWDSARHRYRRRYQQSRAAR